MFSRAGLQRLRLKTRSVVMIAHRQARSGSGDKQRPSSADDARTRRMATGTRSAQAVKAELRRLVLARADIRSAAALLQALVDPPQIRHTDPDDLALGLWTGAVVSYARPFTRSTVGLGKEWGRCKTEDLQNAHDFVLTLRNKLFAHNDRMPYRDVAVVPPQSAVEKRITLDRRMTIAVKRLCMEQLQRIEKKIEQLALELCRGQGWEAGCSRYLDEIPDKLQLVPARSPFQVPRTRRGQSTEKLR